MDASITYIRPRFRIDTKKSRKEIELKLQQLLIKYQSKIKGELVDNHIILDMVDKDIHYWSPQLNFRLVQDEDNIQHTILAGLIGPRPKVWTMFVFIYFTLGIIGFFISSFGISKWMLGEHNNLVWAFPISAAFMLTAYLAGKEGEKLGRDQVEILKDFIMELAK